MKNFERCLDACREAGFGEEITREMLWNEGYRLGRKRWFWGPYWFICLHARLNTQRGKWRLRKKTESALAVSLGVK